MCLLTGDDGGDDAIVGLLLLASANVTSTVSGLRLKTTSEPK